MFPHAFLLFGLRVMKVANSLKTLKTRDRNCRVVRRKGRVYVINKANPRFKARRAKHRPGTLLKEKDSFLTTLVSLPIS